MNDALFAKMTHIRSIHFGLVTLLLLVSYVLFSGWEKRGDISEELARLNATVNQLQRANSHMDVLQHLHVDWFAEIEEDISKSIETQIERKIFWGVSVGVPVHIKSGNCPDPDQHFSYLAITEGNRFLPTIHDRIKYIRQAFEEADWGVNYPSEIRIEKSKIDDWIPNYILIADVSSVKVLAINTPELNNTGKTLNGSIYLEAPERASAITGKNTGIFRSTCRRFDITYVPRRHNLRFSDSYFSTQFPTIALRWADLKNDTPKQIERTYSPKDGLFRGVPDINILGVNVSAKHVGVIAPLVILSFLIFLHLHLVHLRMMAKKVFGNRGHQVVRIGYVSPWFGMMSLYGSRLALFSTVFLAPALVTFICLTFFFEASVPANILITAAVACFGWFVYREAGVCMELEINLTKTPFH